MGAGATLPPLLLDDDEAVAVAIGLRAAASGPVAGMAETTVRALAKLEHLLPAPLRRRVSALTTASVALPPSGPAVDPATLVALAGAIQDRMRAAVRLPHPRRQPRTYAGSSRTGWSTTDSGGTWSAWDLDRDDWRTFRVDRLSPLRADGPRFAPREPPGGDLVAYVTEGLNTATWRYRATVTVHAPAATVRPRLPAGVRVTPAGRDRCRVEVGADHPEMLALYVGLIGADFTVDPERVAGAGRGAAHAGRPLPARRAVTLTGSAGVAQSGSWRGGRTSARSASTSSGGSTSRWTGSSTSSATTACGASQCCRPTSSSPAAYEGSRDDVRRVFAQLCEHMGVDPRRVDLEHATQPEVDRCTGNQLRERVRALSLAVDHDAVKRTDERTAEHLRPSSTAITPTAPPRCAPSIWPRTRLAVTSFCSP